MATSHGYRQADMRRLRLNVAAPLGLLTLTLLALCLLLARSPLPVHVTWVTKWRPGPTRMITRTQIVRVTRDVPIVVPNAANSSTTTVATAPPSAWTPVTAGVERIISQSLLSPAWPVDVVSLSAGDFHLRTSGEVTVIVTCGTTDERIHDGPLHLSTACTLTATTSTTGSLTVTT
jgi:hypothetical protein